MQLKDKLKKRLILIDLDGTTLKDDHLTINPITKNALQDAIKDGHTVCICTGRSLKDTIHIYNELELDSLLVTLDGGHISDPVHKNFKRIVLPISEEVTKSILQHPILKGKIENIIVEYYHTNMIQNSADNFFIVDANAEVPVQGDILKDWKGPCSNLIIKLKTNLNFINIVDTLNAEFGNAVKVKSNLIYGVENIGEKPILIITNKFVNKGFAAEMVAQYYNKDIKDVIAFGDQMNDFEMIKTVGYGIALTSGNPKLKEIASGITELSNDAGGLGDTLNKLLK
ncbi:phosphatase [Mesoplasma entomophilum]|uniref:Hydrolase n=1 Tax=Mesoplasma entomophilum TaxID=2149 RepID=A0A3S5Y0N0_9MOLU|nr:Cof-type HAD-IIB family hydrolase [Mesoplasma entomophilum]ATQ35790.1 hydrolase [Mesoplasma entomophilum]ATZ19759.1 phosphatase [Mesoplasma entomophilum]